MGIQNAFTEHALSGNSVVVVVFAESLRLFARDCGVLALSFRRGVSGFVDCHPNSEYI